MAMNKEFADWYRSASVAPPAALLEQRWAGVEQVAKQISKVQLVELLRLFSGRPTMGLEAPAFLDKAFRDQDSSFPVKGHAEELRVLAGAILRHIVDQGMPASVASAYGLVCTSLGQSYENLPTKDHVFAARRFLVEEAIKVRDGQPAGDAKQAPISRQRLEELLPAAPFHPNQIQTLREPLIVALLELSKIGQLPNEALANIQHLVQVQREEMNLLWWLQTAFSRDLRVPFSDIPLKTAVCVLPTELSDLGTFVPGSPAILGMIISALKQTDGKGQVSIKEAVNATPTSWRARRASQESVQLIGSLCPIQFAISKSLDTDGNDDWLPAFRKHSILNADEGFEPPELAQQMYSECMFIRSLLELT